MYRVYPDKPYFNYIKTENLGTDHNKEMRAFFKPSSSWSEKQSPMGPSSERFLFQASAHHPPTQHPQAGTYAHLLIISVHCKDMVLPSRNQPALHECKQCRCRPEATEVGKREGQREALGLDSCGEKCEAKKKVFGQKKYGPFCCG